MREDYRNVAIRVEDTEEPDAFRVAGRGELQLAVLIESMRREGYELTVSNPEPILHEEGGKILEPYELITCEVPEDAVGRVSEVLGPRRARMVEMRAGGAGRSKVSWRIPARGLIGFRPTFLTETRGEGILVSQFDGYDGWAGPIIRRTNGALVSDRTGDTVPYGLFGLQDRGVFFVGAGVPVYEGMIVGEHSRDNDLVVNVCRTKKLTNVRAAGKGRERGPGHAPGHEPRAVHGVDRRRRAHRGHPQCHPAAQALARSQRPPASRQGHPRRQRRRVERG